MSANITEAIGIGQYRAGSNAPPDALYRVRGTLPVPTFTANGNVGQVTWSDGGAGGSFETFGANLETAAYTPRNKTQAVVISATDNVNTVSYPLVVYGTLPVQPQVGFEVEFDVETKVKRALDRTPYFREEGKVEVGWTLGWASRERDQKDELQRFFFDHKKTKQFHIVDSESNIRNLVWFVSSFKYGFGGANRWNISGAFKGVYQDITAQDAQPLHLKINSGGYPVQDWIADNFFNSGVTFYFGNVAINNSGVPDPAPDEVYRWCRYENNVIIYHKPNLRKNYPYTVRLHFCGAGSERKVRPILQGVSQPNITVPDGYIAVAETYDGILTNEAGSLFIHIERVEDSVNALVSGIEIIEE